MKIASSSLLLLSVLGTAMAKSDDFDDPDKKREACFDCVESLDEAKECLRICNRMPYDPDGDGTGTLEEDGSILNECLDPSRSDSIEDIDDLIDCCNMDKDCEDELEDAQECVANCFDPCIKETSLAYLDCVKDESADDKKGKCNRQSCLDGFLEDLEDDVDGFSGDVLDLKNVEKRIKKIDEDDLEDCELLEDFVGSVCDIGDDCCEACNTDLANVVDCLINDVVIPFVSIEINSTLEECPITEDCGLEDAKSNKSRKAKRHLLSEEELINKAMNLPKSASSSKRNPEKEALLKKADQKRVLEGEKTSEEAVAECTSAMELNTVIYNISYAMNLYMECVSLAGIATLKEGTGDDDSATFKLGGVIAATIATLVGGWVAM